MLYLWKWAPDLFLIQSLLAIVILKEPPGIYYFVFENLSWDVIIVSQIISTSNEFTILVDEDEVDIAFKVIKNLKGL